MFPVPTQGLMGAMSGADISAGIALALDFINGATSLDPRITFSRTSNATLTDSNGRVSYAPHNLLTNSEDFEAASWAKTNATISANAVVAPDGTTTADAVVEATTPSVSHGVRYNFTTINATYTFSVYVKAGARNWVFVQANNFTAGGGLYVNLTNGATGTVAGTLIGYLVTSVGGGWYRISITGTASAISDFFSIFPAIADNTISYTSDGSAGIYVWGAQLNVANAPVNLLTFSEQFDNAAGWTTATQGSASLPIVTANAWVAPNGTTTAERVQFSRTGTTATDRSRLQQTSIALAASTNYPFSVWLKSYDGTNQTLTLFPNFGLGAAVAVTVTNEWQRFTVTADSSASTTGTVLFGLGYVANSVTSADVLVWGAQLNTGSTALPYVATTSSIYLPPSYNSTTPKNLLGFTQEFDNAAWTKSNSFVQTNLLLQSQTFNTGWSLGNLFAFGSGSVADATTAPDGTTTADRLVISTASVYVSLIQGVTVTPNTTYTFSYWLNTTTSLAGNTIRIYNNTAGSEIVAGQACVYSGGWVRQTCTFTTPAGCTQIYVYPISISVGAGTVGQFFDIWGAQLVQGSVPGDYQVTTSAAAAVQYSDPNGTRTADALYETAVTGSHSCTELATTAAAPYTYSVYVKANGRTRIAIAGASAFGGNIGSGIFFDVGTGQYISGATGTPSITDAGGGWWRVAYTWTASVSINNTIGVYLVDTGTNLSYAGDVSKGVYLWGAQLSNSASVDPYAYNPQAALTSTAYYGPRFDYNPTGTPVLGPELVTNGDFSAWSGDNPVGWTINGPEDANNYVTQAGNEARLVSNGGNIGIRQTILTSGQLYRYSITISAISGSAKFVYGISAETVFSTTGVKTGYVIADGTVLEFRRNVACDVTFDNISIQAVTGYTATANGLLIEEQRTNLLTYSEQFDNAAWTRQTNVSVAPNVAVAPDGNTTADRIDWASAANNTGVFLSGVVINGAANTKSVYVRADSAGGTIQIADPVTTAGITTATLTTEWQRVVLSEVAGAQPGNGGLWIRKTASSPSSIYVWGAQLELGAFSTSYIPTVASQVTRAADSAAMLGDNFSTWFNFAQGTFSVSTAQTTSAAFSNGIIGVSAGGSFGTGNGMLLRWNPNVVQAGGNGTSTSTAMAVAAGTAYKTAFSYLVTGASNNTLDLAGNGTLAATLTTLDYTGVGTTAFILGALTTGGLQQGNRWIRSVAFYPTKLPNATLQAITT